jgi:hypothetical protein
MDHLALEKTLLVENASVRNQNIIGMMFNSEIACV